MDLGMFCSGRALPSPASAGKVVVQESRVTGNQGWNSLLPAGKGSWKARNELLQSLSSPDHVPGALRQLSSALPSREGAAWEKS